MPAFNFDKNIEITRRVIAGDTYQDIGDELSISRQRAQQIVRDVLKRCIRYSQNLVKDGNTYHSLYHVRKEAIYWENLLDKFVQESE